MPSLLAAVAEGGPVMGKKLFQANFLTTLSGEALVTLLYHRPLDETWAAAAEALRARLGVQGVVGRSHKKRVVAGRDHVFERLTVDGRELTYKQVEGAFSQPNAGVAQHMLSWAKAAAQHALDCAPPPGGGGEAGGGAATDLLELYCGSGAFTAALAPLFRRCLATEISTAAVATAKENMEANGAANVQLARLSAEELVQARSLGCLKTLRQRRSARAAPACAHGCCLTLPRAQALDRTRVFERLKARPPPPPQAAAGASGTQCPPPDPIARAYSFSPAHHQDVDLSQLRIDTVLVDPPRAGCGRDVMLILQRFRAVVYISCNPATLAADCAVVGESHEVVRFACFDQFPYTPHLECGALLLRRGDQPLAAAGDAQGGGLGGVGGAAAAGGS